MKRVALIQPDQIQSWESGEIGRIHALINEDLSEKRFTLVDNADDCDLLVLLESCSLKNHKHVKEYEGLIDSAIRPGRMLMVINYEDTPSGVLPGIYSSLERTNFDERLHRSWPHMRLPNELSDVLKEDSESGNAYLFSFAGSCSHSIRKKLFDTYPVVNLKYKVIEVKRWYDHVQEEKSTYVDDIRRSKFVLCPRGIASYSHRIIETMALGRVPVIIGDNWIPFSIQSGDYYIRIKESDIEMIEKIVEGHLPAYNKLRASVNSVYSTNFSPQSRYTVALNQLVKLSESVSAEVDANFLKKRLNSREFWSANGWLLSQRIRKGFHREAIIRLRNIKGALKSRTWSSP